MILVNLSVMVTKYLIDSYITVQYISLFRLSIAICHYRLFRVNQHVIRKSGIVNNT